MFVDTHCHLDATYFPNGPDEVLERARKVGVGGFVVIGVGADLAPAHAAVALASRFPDWIAASVGVHPHDAISLHDVSYAQLAELGQDPNVVAIGEIGLDYHYDHSPRETQKATFARLIGLAKQLGKPMVIHTRSAAADTLDILAQEGARDVGGIIHCFSEDQSFAEKALDLGFFISFSGIVTFKNAKAVQQVARWAPLDRVLIETDSPYLAPIPKRGTPNEPAYIVHTAKFVAELRGLSLTTFAETTTANAEHVFRRRFPRIADARMT